ncbi:sigma-70 family RNA polymerase sigma factor [bacterium]|nr:sigma-70 family RNA polymerase sigma factor [bacterium]
MNTTKQDIQCELWLLRWKRGDRSAFEEIVTHYQKPLFYFVRKLVDREEDAWDILQDVWFQALNKIDTLQKPKSLPPWLYKMARNAAVSKFRKDGRFTQLKEEKKHHHFSSLSIDWRKFDAMDLHKALKALSPLHREVIVLHFLEDFPVSEIADIIGVSTGTVKSRLFYAKKTLRERLDDNPTGKDENHA